MDMKTVFPWVWISLYSPGWVLLNSGTAGMSHDTRPSESSYITSDNLLFDLRQGIT